ncbi:MAG: hypothetical protein M1838_001825 [Thelocarpon superellum]|nr:MAG: hypothetical protein M1838_001825 [Thelocarpon superellum]
MPSSVTILTTDPVPDRADSHSTIKKPPGMTLSTFTTLSLHPVPLVTFNVRLPSSTYDSITLYPSQPFYIHFPASTLDGAALARHFSGLRSGGKTTPTDLTGSESLVASLKCQMEGLEGWHVNDHVIVVARVLAISSPSPSPSSSRSAPASVDEGSVLEHQRMEQGPEGLMYINRSYRSAGPRIDPPSS